MTPSRAILVSVFLLAAAAGFVGGRALARARHDRSVTAVLTVRPAGGVFVRHPQSLRAAVPFPAAAPADAGDRLKAEVERCAGNLTSDARFDDFLAALRAWAAINPEAALAFARAHLNVARESQAVIALLEDWARRDPQSAWSWAGVKHPEEGRHIATVLKEIGKADAAAAWRRATEYSGTFPKQAQYSYSCALQGILFTGQYETAARLMNQVTLPAMPDGLDGKFGLADPIVSEWAQYEPEKAAQWWTLSLPDDSIAKGRSLVNLTQGWAENNPVKAADFAVSLSLGGERDNALTQVLTEWLTQDPARAAAWINLYPNDPSLDNAKAALVRNQELIANNLTLALSWANSITDEQMREYNLTGLFETWLKRDPAGAYNYLLNSPELQPEMRDRVLTALNDPPRLPTAP